MGLESDGLTREEMREANRIRKELNEILTKRGRELVAKFPDKPVGFVWGFAFLSDDRENPVKTQLMAAGDDAILKNIFHAFIEDMPTISRPAYRLMRELDESDKCIANLADKTTS